MTRKEAVASDSSKPVGQPHEKYGCFINWGELDILIGRLLTHVEATVTDPVQREANKSLVKLLVRNWMRENEQDHIWGKICLNAQQAEQSTEYVYDGIPYYDDAPRSIE